MTMPKFEPVAFVTYKGYLLHAEDPKVLEHSDPSPLFAEEQLQQAYAAGQQAPSAVPEGWVAIHLKTGNEYQVTGEAINATNGHSNQLMVIYERDGKKYVREAEEFQEKFTAAPKERK